MDTNPTPKTLPRPTGGPPSFHLLAKPSGATCNIDCTYCFFLSKEALYPNEKSRMSEETLETYLRQLLESHLTPHVTVAWQGGEPTLMKLPFFKRAVELDVPTLAAGPEMRIPDRDVGPAAPHRSEQATIRVARCRGFDRWAPLQSRVGAGRPQLPRLGRAGARSIADLGGVDPFEDRPARTAGRQPELVVDNGQGCLAFVNVLRRSDRPSDQGVVEMRPRPASHG